MIAKTADLDRPTDTRNSAGLAAEQTMAFYLRRAFQEDPEVFVFNDLRLTRGGEVAQIDHLVVHHGGMIIVESKSVSGEIEVNECGEWSRRVHGRQEGMPSPVLQARRQEALLRALLLDHSERLRDRMLLGTVQARFTRHWPVDIFVAVSDGGRITRHTVVPELRKADQVVDEIAEIARRHKRGRWSLNPLNTDGDLWLSSVEMGRVVQFLISSHTPKNGVRGEGSAPRRPDSAPQRAEPLVAPRADPRGEPPAVPTGDPCCRHCGSSRVYMRYARTSRPYYFRCLACEKNTPAVWVCATCGADARIRKHGREFDRICAGCGTTEHVFTNPVDAPAD